MVGLLEREVAGHGSGHSDREHAGGMGGGEAARRVLERRAMLRVNAEATRSQQVDVGRRLRVLDFVGSGDGPEAARKTGDVQNAVHPGPVGVRGHGAGDTGGIKRVQNRQHARHRRHPINGGLVVRLPPRPSRLPVVTRPDCFREWSMPVVLALPFGRADCVCPSFDGQVQPLLFVDGLPGMVVRAFGVGQQAVTVEDCAEYWWVKYLRIGLYHDREFGRGEVFSCYNALMSSKNVPEMRGNKERGIGKRGNKFLRCGARTPSVRLRGQGADCVCNPILRPRRWTVGVCAHSRAIHCHVLFLILSLCLLTPARAQTALIPALDKILSAPALKGGVTGAIVCRVRDGRVLYAHNADLRLLPASNRKLFTAAAALALLGPKFHADTDVLANAKPDADGTVMGDLYLRGGGDGLLSVSDLDALAGALSKRGVRKITGDVVGDGSRFAGEPYGFGWEWDDFSDEEFPQISALEVSEGVLTVHVAPGQAPGDPVTATLDPPTGYVPVIITAQTGAKNAPNTCTVTKPWQSNEFRVAGTLPIGKALDVKVPVDKPALLAATLLRDALARHGITVGGKPVLGKTPLDALVLVSHSGLPLPETLARMNKPSDNLLAESFVRLLDAQGTYDAGHARETPFFRSLGVDTSEIDLVDGCGVGRRNYVSARSVAALLLGMHRRKDWPLYYQSLPIAGVDGTLKSRMIGTLAQNNVHAKTGTLSQARALSGYVTGRHGDLYAFSLLMNNYPGKARSAGAVQDTFVEWLAGHL